ncbi:MAG TPA: FtsX-like permease family protein [Hanamia sp.]|nr:FtsX-like permease family protein [Hanamia sp.]
MKKYYAGNANKDVFRFKLQPLNDIHFNTDLNGYADKKYLWAAALIGLFLIITACVNFINLATAQALNRSKEVGIRKVLGNNRKQLFWQFIAETTLITLLAVILAFALAQLGLPFLNNLFKTHLTISPFTNSSLLIFIAVIVCIVVFLSGSYPALVLSGSKPIAALKGKLSQKSVGGFSLRRGLVITQFAISQLLIIGAIIIAGQMSFSKNTYLGFTKNNIVMLPVPVNDSIGKLKMQLLKNELREIPNVQQLSFCMEAPASQHFDTKSLTYDYRS